YFLLDHPYIPGVARTKVAAAAGYAKTALSPVGAEGAIGPADRSAFPKGNLVCLFLRLGLWFFMGRGRNFLGLYLGLLRRNINCIRFFLFFNLRLLLRPDLRLLGLALVRR